MVLILLADGFEEAEALVTADLLRRGGLETALVAVKRSAALGMAGRLVVGAHGITVAADRLLERNEPVPELLVLPGGLGGVEGILNSEAAMDLIRRTAEQGAPLGAICAAPMILARLGLLEGSRAVIYPGMEDELGGALPQPGERVVEDGDRITAAAAGSVFDFALCLLARMKGRDTADQVRRSVHY